MDSKISNLPAASDVTGDDLIPIVNTPSGTPTSQKATAAQLLAYVEGAIGTAAFRALLDDADVAALLATLGAAPLDSPALTGTPSAPTAAPGTNTTLIATTAFVAAAVTGGSIADGDKGDVVVSGSGSVWTVDNDAITYAKIQNVSATDKLLGRSSSGAGDIEEIALTSAGRDLLDDANNTAQRATLGLGTAAVKDTGTGAGNVILGTDARLTDARTPTTHASTHAAAGTDPLILTATQISDFNTAVRTNRLDQMATAGADVSLNSHKLTNLTDPSSAQDAATKAYVDAAAQGLDVKPSVRAATTANITLSGAQTIDGVSVVAGDRVLVKAQSTGSQNGLYVAASGVWTRSTDADTSGEVTAGLFVFVTEGTSNADSGWILTTDDPITVGSTVLTFVQFSGAGQITDGAGLTKTGNTIDVNVDGSTLEISSDALRVKDAGVALAKMANIATASVIGRATAGAGVPEVLSASQMRSLFGDKLGLTPTAVKVANYSAAAGDFIPCDTSGGAFAVTFPTAPADGSVLAIKLVMAGNALTLTLGGSDVFNKSGGAATGSLSITNQGIVCQYASGIWYVLADDIPYSTFVKRTAVSNANYPILSTDRYIAQTGTMSAARTWTLPAASSVTAGQEIVIADESGTATSTNTITIARAGSDTINGATSILLNAAYTRLRLISDGTSKWTIVSAAGAAFVFTSTTSGWAIPAWASVLSLEVIGGGGGGGSGRRGGAASLRGGGGGGGSGGRTIRIVRVSDLAATLDITIGAGGAAGAARTADNTDGAAGGTGGGSTIGIPAGTTLVSTSGGGGGGAGTTAVGGAGGGAAAGGAEQGVVGGAGSVGAAAGSVGTTSAYAPSAGGGGGGISSGDAVQNGGAGGTVRAAIVGGTAGTAGGNGGAGINGHYAGAGGGGGASSITAAGGAGGSGGTYGAGGGGGGASLNGNNSGAGGAGTQGVAIVIAW